jgi:hypothetical protein
MKSTKTIEEISEILFDKLSGFRHLTIIPKKEIIEDLFSNLFYTSMKTEEGQFIKVSVTFIDPEDPDPTPPENISNDRWSTIPFEKKIPLNVKNLTKLSKAVDPWSSALAVYYDENDELIIWGMIDQAIHYQSYLNHERKSGADQPGFFQVSITSIGCLTVMIDYELLATLKYDSIIKNYTDIFKYGPVSDLIDNYNLPKKETIGKFTLANFNSDRLEYWIDQPKSLWVKTLSRILIKVQNYQHGGAILIPIDSSKELNIKHKINYKRLKESMYRLIEIGIEKTFYSDEGWEKYIEPDEENMPVKIYLNEMVATNDEIETDEELKGAIRFVSSLSCVDGLIVMSSELDVLGFGTVITTQKPPSKVYVSKTGKISAKTRLSEYAADHFGTRHRSMFAYCYHNPGSLGFIVSQDGDIRAVLKLGTKLIMWENIKVQHFSKSKIKYRKPKRYTSLSLF